MRRIMCVVVLAAALSPGIVQAGAWHMLDSPKLKFSLRYPASWKASVIYRASIKMAFMFQRSSPADHSMTIVIQPIRAAGSMKMTLRRYIDFKSRPLGTGRKRAFTLAYAHARWTATSLGGRPAMMAVISPPKKSKLSISNVVYVSASRGQVYEVNLNGYHKPPWRKVSQFPSIYKTILSSFRFR